MKDPIKNAEVAKIASETAKNLEEAKRIAQEAAKIKAEAEKIIFEKELLEKEDKQVLYKKKIFWAFVPNFAIWSAFILFTIQYVIIPASQIQNKSAIAKIADDSLNITIQKFSLLHQKLKNDSLANDNEHMKKALADMTKLNTNTTKKYLDKVNKYLLLARKCSPQFQKAIEEIPALSELHFNLKYTPGTIPFIFTSIAPANENDQNQVKSFLLSPITQPLILPTGTYNLSFKDGSGFRITAPVKIVVNRRIQEVTIQADRIQE